ncbi:MAG: hypothetical protein H6850_01475 [Alphaproteobacteria bacterium]|nr:MAG: hypothetical protein H6850_01475 [Alphaproteobacteria bacterium]
MSKNNFAGKLVLAICVSWALPLLLWIGSYSTTSQVSSNVSYASLYAAPDDENMQLKLFYKGRELGIVTRQTIINAQMEELAKITDPTTWLDDHPDPDGTYTVRIPTQNSNGITLSIEADRLIFNDLMNYINGNNVEFKREDQTFWKNIAIFLGAKNLIKNIEMHELFPNLSTEKINHLKASAIGQKLTELREMSPEARAWLEELLNNNTLDFSMNYPYPSQSADDLLRSLSPFITNKDDNEIKRLRTRVTPLIAKLMSKSHDRRLSYALTLFAYLEESYWDKIVADAEKLYAIDPSEDLVILASYLNNTPYKNDPDKFINFVIEVKKIISDGMDALITALSQGVEMMGRMTSNPEKAIINDLKLLTESRPNAKVGSLWRSYLALINDSQQVGPENLKDQWLEIIYQKLKDDPNLPLDEAWIGVRLNRTGNGYVLEQL